MRILEERLDRMDQRARHKDPESLQTRDLTEEEAKPQKELLKKIELSYLEYGNQEGTLGS